MLTSCLLRGALLVLLLIPACSSTDAGEGADLSLSDGQLTRSDRGSWDGAGLTRDGGSDGALDQSCQPGPGLLGRVSDQRLRATLEHLTGMQRSTQAGQAAAADYLAGELQQLAGVTLHRQTYSSGGQSYANLEVTLPGDALAGEFVLAGAHYDAVAGSPGADDDASGTAAVLEAARALAGCRPRRSIRLLFFSNEEQGTLGSQAYVAAIKNTLPPAKVRGFINVDMVGYGRDTDLVLATKPDQEAFAVAVQAAIKQWTPLAAKTLIDEQCG